jgi:FkbM family methyltransferase
MVKPPFWLYANGRTCRLAAGDEPGSGSCYSEVAVEDCYGLFSYARSAKPNVIVDIGANIGVFSKLCSMLFPDADIYAYEPNPRALPWLRENAAGTRIRVFPVAVQETSGPVKLDTTVDSTIGRVGDDGNLVVDSFGVSKLADGRAIDLLKLDCEGSEWSILKDPCLLKRTKDLRMEYHLFQMQSIDELRDMIHAGGHRIVWSQSKPGTAVGLLRSVRCGDDGFQKPPHRTRDRWRLLKRLRNSARLLRRSRFHYYRYAVAKPPYWLWANGQLCRVAADDEPGAGSCYSEVAVEDCYGIFGYARRAKPKVIVDVGAHLGMFSKLCSMLFPDADIYAYEPHPRPLKFLHQNAEGTRIRVMPVAVAEKAGLARLDTSCDSTNARVTDEGDLEIQCVAASSVAEGREIDFLKMDCEGSEWSILRDPSLLARTREFCLAYHLDGRPVEELLQLVEASGHRIVECVGTDKGRDYGMIRSVRETPTAMGAVSSNENPLALDLSA